MKRAIKYKEERRVARAKAKEKARKDQEKKETRRKARRWPRPMNPRRTLVIPKTTSTNEVTENPEDANQPTDDDDVNRAKAAKEAIKKLEREAKARAQTSVENQKTTAHARKFIFRIFRIFQPKHAKILMVKPGFKKVKNKIQKNEQFIKKFTADFFSLQLFS
ncbi:MAG: hypothetical protein M1827_005307 [Pycnora praestabilis]|nr:MAG: hypothetical protein M1827_005307 [Pycnora praestabilis]